MPGTVSIPSAIQADPSSDHRQPSDKSQRHALRSARRLGPPSDRPASDRIERMLRCVHADEDRSGVIMAGRNLYGIGQDDDGLIPAATPSPPREATATLSYRA